MQNILNKLAIAKQAIAETEVKKAWRNSYSEYHYFTPEQVNKLVQDVCQKLKLFTKFDLIRDEHWIEWQLTIYDLESDENIVFIGATAIPEIKATNVAQQIWWCMTYTERYLKMTAFWIADNSLDFDTTENTKKTVQSKSETQKGSEAKPTEEKPRFNKPELEKLSQKTEYLKKFESSEKLIESIEKKYRVSKTMKSDIADVRSDVE